MLRSRLFLPLSYEGFKKSGYFSLLTNGKISGILLYIPLEKVVLGKWINIHPSVLPLQRLRLKQASLFQPFRVYSKDVQMLPLLPGRVSSKFSMRVATFAAIHPECPGKTAAELLTLSFTSLIIRLLSRS